MARALLAKPRTPEERRIWSWAINDVRRGRVSGLGVPLPWALAQVLGARPAEGGGEGEEEGGLFFLFAIFIYDLKKKEKIMGKGEKRVEKRSPSMML